MTSIFHPAYWLTMQAPEVGGLAGKAFFFIFALSLILGIVGRIVTDKKGADRYKREIGDRVSTLLSVMGVLGLILFFFSYEGIQLFGARFWYPLWIIGTAYWVYRIVRYVKRDIPEMKARSEANKEKRKYLPKTKKRRRR